MIHPNNVGKLLVFPGPVPAPGSAAQEWNVRILETKDNLVSALDYLRIAYNEMLAGRPVKAADEIVAHVEAILKSHEKPTPVHGCEAKWPATLSRGESVEAIKLTPDISDTGD